MSGLALDPAASLALRVALAALWLAAAAHKLRDPVGFRAAVAGYRLLPARLCGAAAGALVALELALGAGLLLPGASRVAAAGAAALLALYAGAIALALARGRRGIDCGCLGAAARRPLGAGLVARNLVLAGGALACALPVVARPLVWLDAVSVVGGAAALAVLYAAADVALAQAPVLRALREAEWSTR